MTTGRALFLQKGTPGFRCCAPSSYALARALLIPSFPPPPVLGPGRPLPPTSLGAQTCAVVMTITTIMLMIIVMIIILTMYKVIHTLLSS